MVFWLRENPSAPSCNCADGFPLHLTCAYASRVGGSPHFLFVLAHHSPRRIASVRILPCAALHHHLHANIVIPPLPSIRLDHRTGYSTCRMCSSHSSFLLFSLLVWLTHAPKSVIAPCAVRAHSECLSCSYLPGSPLKS